ncbi:hypothetical protein [Rathayibacter sp. AY1A7]|uniref:hypothetical protein n=1 Tax=Rathayibacter sp. AY1A7 TaxID=2080524 RepID=UPI0011B034D9|nr:hypothetical protein [Rathayibacter sp. AY1A7]
MITPSQAGSVLRGEVTRFNALLPAGVSWPTSLPDFLKEKDVKMDASVPRAIASIYWLCAWEDSYVTAVDEKNDTQASASLKEIAKFVELPFYKEQFVDPEGAWLKNVLQKAQSGDASGVREDLQQCGYFQENNPA